MVKGKNEVEGSTAHADPTSSEPNYGKAQLMAASRYAGRRDLLEALLSESGAYSIADVEQKIAEFMKGGM